MHKIRPHQLAGMVLAPSGLAMMTGWLTHQPRVHQLLADYLPVALSAVLCFFMAGLALLAPQSRPRLANAAQLAATLVLAVLGGLSMLQHLGDADFGVDRLFATPILIDGLRPPARMSPLASLGFVLAAACFGVLRRLGSSRPVQLTVQVLSHALLALGIFGLVGYSLKLEVLYGWYRFARMAPYSAVCFVVLGAALWGLWFGTMQRSGVYTDREDKRIAAIATLILFVLAFTGGLTGFVLTTQRTEASLWQGMEAALANRTQLIDTVIADRVQLSGALAADPAMVAALRAAGGKSAGAAPHEVPQRFVGPLVTGMVLLSADGKPVVAQGRLDSRPRFALAARSGVTLLWNGRTLLEVAAPVMRDGKRLGTLVTQHVLTPVDRLLADAGLPGQTGQLLVCGAAAGGGHIACLPSRLQPDGYVLASRINANDGKPSRRPAGGPGAAL